MELKVLEVWSFGELYETSWSGAKDTLDTIREEEKEQLFLDHLNSLLECYDNGLGRTELNDYIWFDREVIFEALGIDYE